MNGCVELVRLYSLWLVGQNNHVMPLTIMGSLPQSVSPFVPRPDLRFDFLDRGLPHAFER